MLQVSQTCNTACCRARRVRVGFVCRALSPRQALALESGFGLFSQYVLHSSGSLIFPRQPCPAWSCDSWRGEGTPQKASTGGTVRWSSPRETQAPRSKVTS